MAGPEKKIVDDVTGTGTTGHEWDGIRELDTPLPRWWLYIFYATIAAAFVYWILMPAWPLPNGYTPGLLGQSDRRNVAAEMRALNAARAGDFARIQNASYDQIIADPDMRDFAFAAGEAAFGDNCRTCHGAGGAGAPGFPSLADDVWIWGGSLDDIEHTIRVGVRAEHSDTRASQMPAFGRDHILTPAQISDVTEHVLSLGPARDRTQPRAGAAFRGAAIYQAQCAICHGPTGEGDRRVGAPSLKDDIWLYGGGRADVRRQIELGRGGVMPTWERRFDAATIRALAVYVYALGGGEPAQTPLAEPTEANQAAAQDATGAH
ncbi:MAG: cytochrome-c oxidase, cbb3-type subunit III [Hyphomonadaceae bacterium]